MLEVYRHFAEHVLALPVIAGTKTPTEKFPGADDTYTIEAMMQDRKALQLGTSHYLGQNFAKGFEIRFTNLEGQLEYAYTTSWGVTTRLIGGLIMVHSDDDGLRLPPRIAPRHLVIIPFITKPETAAPVLQAAEEAAARLRQVVWEGRPLEVSVDRRDLRGGEKNWQWIKKGVPVRVELGLRDIEEGVVTVGRRDKGPKETQKLSLEALAKTLPALLTEIQENYYRQASELLRMHTHSDIEDWKALVAFFTPENESKPEIHGGFVRAKWCGDNACEAKLTSLKVSIRCLPLEQSGKEGTCVICNRKATTDALYAKSY
jgi:prolyl-tRNA synthetase